MTTSTPGSRAHAWPREHLCDGEPDGQGFCAQCGQRFTPGPVTDVIAAIADELDLTQAGAGDTGLTAAGCAADLIYRLASQFLPAGSPLRATLGVDPPAATELPAPPLRWNRHYTDDLVPCMWSLVPASAQAVTTGRGRCPSRCLASAAEPASAPDGPARVVLTGAVVHDGRGATYVPWTDGYGVGFRAQLNGQEERIIYLNPSSGGDCDPDVFIYLAAPGQVRDGHPEGYIEPFGPGAANGVMPVSGGSAQLVRGLQDEITISYGNGTRPSVIMADHDRAALLWHLIEQQHAAGVQAAIWRTAGPDSPGRSQVLTLFGSAVPPFTAVEAILATRHGNWVSDDAVRAVQAGLAIQQDRQPGSI